MSAIDVEAIKDLKARYFRLLDTKQWPEWRTLFVDDAVFEVENQPTVDRADAWVDGVSSGLIGATTVHQGHMPEIQLTGPDTAVGVWAMQTSVEIPTADGSHGWQSYGHYTEAYRRDADGWKIASLRLTRLRFDPLDGAPQPAFEALPRMRPRAAVETAALDDAGLVELEAIAQLKARYFRFLDTKDWPQWRRVFTDDASFDVIGAGDVANADEFVASVSIGLATAVTAHHGHTPELQLIGPDRATGAWALNDLVQYPAAGRAFRGFGHYDEEYAKVDGEWKIASTRLSYLRVDPDERQPWTPSPMTGVSDGWLDAGSPADVSQLHDLEAIRLLKARYLRYLDTKQWDDYRRLFTPDARISSPRLGDTTEDVEAFVASLRHHLDGVVTVHHGHMPEIVFTGADTARGIWSLFDHLEWGGTGQSLRGYGHYEEEYRRDGDGWRISYLRFSRLHEERIGFDD